MTENKEGNNDVATHDPESAPLDTEHPWPVSEAIPEEIFENFPVEKGHTVEPSNDVAVTDGFGDAPEAGSQTLEELMKLSRETPEASQENDLMDMVLGVPWTSFRPNPSPGMIAIPTPEEIAALKASHPLLSRNEETGEVKVIPDGLGPQPNGDYAVVVTVREGYWPLVEQQAASDGITPSEWLSQHLMEYLEAYATPPRNA